MALKRLDMLSTIKGSLLDGFYPRGWDLARIDTCCAMGLKKVTVRDKHWHRDFRPIVVRDVRDMDRKMGDAIADEIERARRRGQKLALILPVGPMGMYDTVVARIKRSKTMCDHVTTFNMDEWADRDGNTIPMGSPEAGELLVGGRHMMKEYWNNPKATAETLKDGWLHTGDICTWDSEGFVTICDRMKDMIISGGENIYPAELENVLAACPEVQEAAVIGVYHPKWDERPLLIVQLKQGQSATREDILKFMDGKIAKWWMPDDVAFVDGIPHTATGKILKTALRDQFKSYRFPNAAA